ncbi:von Willebrand factor A domain-containing protein 1 [Takifugu rubripes]|uniref:von Willebrand factor A domain-containing protein 1 n=1 Tax=Takifugu rubripes TaxID=31033 RepID=H2TKF2_TAKRU|nr:von Willebrand factor A domain-containing protein 1 [Takifugu rubripes]
MRAFLICCAFIWATFQQSNMQLPIPATEANCCEGDILLLLDSSGSVTNYEFSRFLHFSATLLRVFSLGRGHVRVGLLQVGTESNLEFGLDAHTDQRSLQKALERVQQLQGDTNTENALRDAQQLLRAAGGNVPRILLWLTDGASPGDVGQVMSELKAEGVFVLAVSAVHGNYRLLRDAVSPPSESHLYVVDIDDIEIITEDLRDAIIKIIQANRLQVVNLTPRTATLQWRPLLTAATGYYQLQYYSVRNPAIGSLQYLSGDSISVELTHLVPDTAYTATLLPGPNQRLFNALSVNFSTPSEVLGPTVVSVPDSGPCHIRVEWGPPQVAQVLRYTVEYSAFPSGRVHMLTLQSQQNFSLLTGLVPATQYLVTVSALYAGGKERAMSVRACTKEATAALPALLDLQLSKVPQQDLWQVTWQAHQEHLKGYWLTWEQDKPVDSISKPSALYLPPTTGATHLSHVSPGSRVCMSPVYSSGRGDGICCSAEEPSDWRRTFP